MDDVIALFHRYKDPVYRLALSFTGSPADAEDVTQTVFLKYLETQPELEEGKERAWLLQVTANQCRDLWRRLRRRATVPLDEAQAVAVLPPRVEALNQQAASELEHLRIASPHTICWALASPGSSDTAQITAHSMGVQELPARTDASRTWQVDLNFDGFMGKQDRPLLLWLDFMGEDHAVSIPLDTMLEPIHLTPNEPVTIDTITGQQAILKEFTLSATSYSLELQVEGLPAHTRPQTSSVPLFLRMKDGSVMTRAQLLSPSGGQQFRTVLDLSQVASVIYGYTEFPTDGSAPRPAQLDARLYPFRTEIIPEPFHGTARSYIADAAVLCRGLGADCSWDPVSRSLTAVYHGTTLELTAGSSTALIDGVPSVMETVQYDPSGQAVSVPLPACENGSSLSAIDQVFLDAWDLDACVESAYHSELELPPSEHLIIIP